jgi:hypothetical protein
MTQGTIVRAGKLNAMGFTWRFALDELVFKELALLETVELYVLTRRGVQEASLLSTTENEYE